MRQASTPDDHVLLEKRSKHLKHVELRTSLPREMDMQGLRDLILHEHQMSLCGVI